MFYKIVFLIFIVTFLNASKLNAQFINGSAYYLSTDSANDLHISSLLVEFSAPNETPVIKINFANNSRMSYCEDITVAVTKGVKIPDGYDCYYNSTDMFYFILPQDWSQEDSMTLFAKKQNRKLTFMQYYSKFYSAIIPFNPDSESKMTLETFMLADNQMCFRLNLSLHHLHIGYVSSGGDGGLVGIAEKVTDNLYKFYDYPMNDAQERKDNPEDLDDVCVVTFKITGNKIAVSTTGCSGMWTGAWVAFDGTYKLVK